MIRLVALTGYGQDSDRERSAAAGFDDHLVKPIDLGRLNAVIQNLTSGRKAGLVDVAGERIVSRRT